jgi:hypothetical protein
MCSRAWTAVPRMLVRCATLCTFQSVGMVINVVQVFWHECWELPWWLGHGLKRAGLHCKPVDV